MLAECKFNTPRSYDYGMGTIQSLAQPMQTLGNWGHALIYNFPVRISSPIFRIGVRFSG